MEEFIEAIKRGGAAKLHVLSDFDRTLTKSVVDGKKIPSLISVLRDGKYLAPGYAKKAQALFDTYHTIERDPEVPYEEKKEKMREWWTKHFALLIESGLTLHDIKAALKKREAKLRDGAEKFMRILERNSVPLVIMSASGLGVDSIRIFLENEELLLSNIHIISNQYEWDKNGKAIRVREPIIHGMNKDETLIKNFPDIYTHIAHRTNLILLGDNDGDLGMVQGFPYEHLLTVGFGPQTLSFAVSLPEDSDFSPVLEILKKIL